MRVYEGTPRERWQEVLRVLGALADREALRELLLLELDEGLVLQALTLDPVRSRSEWAALHKRTLTFDDDEIARLMEEGRAQRAAEEERATADAAKAKEAGAAQAGGAGDGGAGSESHAPRGEAHYYEHALRVIGAYVDEQRARDVFFLEQGGSFVVRLLQLHGSSVGHSLAEFTREEIESMMEAAPEKRAQPPEA